MGSADTPADTPEGEVDLWEVHLQPAQDELGKLGMASVLTAPPHRAWLETELLADGTEGDSKLVLTIRARTPEEARAAAVKTYSTTRALAGLPPDRGEPVMVIGVRSPIWRDRIGDLLDEAEVLIHEGRPELAVVRCQTACELWAKDALEGAFCGVLGRPRGETAMKICRPSMTDRRTRQIIFTVLGVQIGEEPWWPAYDEHITRRHGIVHDGLVVTADDASASMAAVRDCIRGLRRGWAGEHTAADPAGN